jgi:uncharacterized protein YceK
MKKIMVLMAVAGILFAGCKKQSCASQSSEAIILDQGPVAADGCDWVIKLGNGTSYHPQNLAAAYQVNNKNVNICYTLTADTFLCGWGVKIGVIHIDDIKGI